LKNTKSFILPVPARLALWNKFAANSRTRNLTLATGAGPLSLGPIWVRCQGRRTQGERR
jgi:hypothetical protein